LNEFTLFSFQKSHCIFIIENPIHLHTYKSRGSYGNRRSRRWNQRL